MEVIIEPDVEGRIWEFYYNAMLNHPNTYFPDNADRDISKVCQEVRKVGTQLRKLNLSTTDVIRKWKG